MSPWILSKIDVGEVCVSLYAQSCTKVMPNNTTALERDECKEENKNEDGAHKVPSPRTLWLMQVG